MVVAMAATLVACEKDDTSSDGSGASIVGTWSQTSEKTVIKVNGQVIQDTTVYYPADSFLFVFNANGTAISSTKDTLQYTYNNGKVTFISYYDGQYDTSIVNANVTATNLTLTISQIDSFMGQLYDYNSIVNFRRK